MQRISRALFCGVLSAGAGLVPGTTLPVQADIVLEFAGVSVSPANATHFRWTYNVMIGPVGRANAPGDGTAGPAAPSPGSPSPGDFATLYDFQGFTGIAGVLGPVAPDWMVTTPLAGPTPGVAPDGHFPFQMPPDNAGVANVSFRKVSGAAFLGPSPGPIGQFFADSLFNNMALGTYTSADHVHSPGNLLDNTSQSRISSVLTAAAPAATPEPGSTLLCGFCAPAALGLLRKKQPAGV